MSRTGRRRLPCWQGLRTNCCPAARLFWSFGVCGLAINPVWASQKLHPSDHDGRVEQEQPLIQTGLAPTDDRESAMLLFLQPGAYTAIVRGKNNAVGVGLVEVYDLHGK